jgi:hypothetical protein
VLKRAEASHSLTPRDSSLAEKRAPRAKYKQSRRKDGDNDSDNEVGNPKQPIFGDTRPYKIQRELEYFGIGADYLRTNGMDPSISVHWTPQAVSSLSRGGNGERSTADMMLVSS